VIITAEGTEQDNHAKEECPALGHNLAGMMEVTDQRFQLPKPTETLSSPLFQQCNDPVSLIRWKVSLQFFRVQFNPKDG